jgi:hypothetical protein
MMAAWIAVIGSLGGVAVGGGVSYFIERTRWRQAETTRWHDQRRELYARFMRAADELRAASAAVGNVVNLPENDESVRAALARMQAAGARLDPIRWDLELLAGADVGLAVAQIHSLTIRRMAIQLALAEAKTEKAFDEQLQNLSSEMSEWRSAVAVFRNAARREIGLPE